MLTANAKSYIMRLDYLSMIDNAQQAASKTPDQDFAVKRDEQERYLSPLEVFAIHINFNVNLKCLRK
jgi:hypothetical protein